MSKQREEDLSGSLGFSEEDVRVFSEDPRLLATAHMYAQGQLMLREAIRIYDARSSGMLHKRFQFNKVAYGRLFHTIAKKIVSGEICLPAGLMDQFTDLCLRDRKAEGGKPRDYSYSEIENMPPEESVFTPRRDDFTEEDIDALIQSPLNLACFDAYGKNFMSLAEARKRMFGTDIYSYPPRQLSFIGFFKLAREVVKRIESQEIILPSDIREAYAHIYMPSESSAED